MTHTLPLRLKRLRQTPAVRSMLKETHLHMSQIIAPLFISEVAQNPEPIQSMPGCYQLPLSALADEIKTLSALGIQAVLLFGIPAKKDKTGSTSLKSTSIIQQAIQLIKETNSELLVIADVCFCEYTSHGHCGVLDGECIDNDKTLTELAKQAVSYAKAGADWVAPSSMTDGMVDAIREALDKHHFQNTAILSYAVKYSSAFYGPFREAAQGSPQFGDRKTYQMDPANANEALREAELDVSEGADLIMVKPAMQYLDIIHRVKTRFPDVPLCAYQVSGEYSMLKAAAREGLIDEEAAMLESLIAIKRAGADLIITYFAKDLAKLIGSN
ncbi:MAG: porphobilinogen synthase [Gammaproteobacteria bacterium]|nr:porphobilinogen synthase [Gammaproteobacteria bacterium]